MLYMYTSFKSVYVYVRSTFAPLAIFSSILSASFLAGVVCFNAHMGLYELPQHTPTLECERGSETARGGERVINSDGTCKNNHVNLIWPP